MSIRWSENDELFKKLLATGQEMERYVAERLRADGFDAFCPPQSTRESIADVADYADQIDVIVRRGEKSPIYLEVRSRDVSFTCPEDIPEHRNPLFVTDKASWERAIAAGTKPHLYVCVSQHTGAIIAISLNTFKEWGVFKSRDRVRNFDREWFTASRTLWRDYSHLTDWLEQVGCTRGDTEPQDDSEWPVRPDVSNWADNERCSRLLKVIDKPGGVFIPKLGKRGRLVNAQPSIPHFPPGVRVVLDGETEIVKGSDTKKNPRGEPISRDFRSEEVEVA